MFGSKKVQEQPKRELTTVTLTGTCNGCGKSHSASMRTLPGGCPSTTGSCPCGATVVLT